MNEQQVGQIMAIVEQVYPDCYGYTDPDTWGKDELVYLIFRNREESFDKSKAVVRVHYEHIRLVHRD
jgi:hypothetical protein